MLATAVDERGIDLGRERVVVIEVLVAETLVIDREERRVIIGKRSSLTGANGIGIGIVIVMTTFTSWTS